jgi:hypothetical protein
MLDISHHLHVTPQHKISGVISASVLTEKGIQKPTHSIRLHPPPHSAWWRQSSQPLQYSIFNIYPNGQYPVYENRLKCAFVQKIRNEPFLALKLWCLPNWWLQRWKKNRSVFLCAWKTPRKSKLHYFMFHPDSLLPTQQEQQKEFCVLSPVVTLAPTSILTKQNNTFNIQ